MHQSPILYFTDRVWFVRVWRGGMPERPQDRLRASKPSFPSQESKTDEDCQERGRETRSEVSARSKAQAMRRSVTIHTTQISVFLISLACFKRFRCFQTRVNSRENTKSKEAEKDSRLLNSQVHLFE